MTGRTPQDTRAEADLHLDCGAFHLSRYERDGDPADLMQASAEYRTASRLLDLVWMMTIIKRARP